MRQNGILVSLRLVKVNNTLKKPGPVFIEMARAAYAAGAHYFYRVNDDTELMMNWPKKFVDGLLSLHPPYGVVGTTMMRCIRIICAVSVLIVVMMRCNRIICYALCLCLCR